MLRSLELRRAIAEQLTDAVNHRFLNPGAPLASEELRERTVVHFIADREGDFFIGGNFASLGNNYSHAQEYGPTRQRPALICNDPGLPLPSR